MARATTISKKIAKMSWRIYRERCIMIGEMTKSAVAIKVPLVPSHLFIKSGKSTTPSPKSTGATRPVTSLSPKSVKMNAVM
ncbi:MAG: hypothetical protein BWY83_03393 [bacterium ADurb.Bin478]|nr:MAG: hypothetical protein BWY83_03393 [bacterium ADurb.Bin478]